MNAYHTALAIKRRPHLPFPRRRAGSDASTASRSTTRALGSAKHPWLPVAEPEIKHLAVPRRYTGHVRFHCNRPATATCGRCHSVLPSPRARFKLTLRSNATAAGRPALLYARVGRSTDAQEKMEIRLEEVEVQSLECRTCR